MLSDPIFFSELNKLHLFGTVVNNNLQTDIDLIT